MMVSRQWRHAPTRGALFRAMYQLLRHDDVVMMFISRWRRCLHLVIHNLFMYNPGRTIQTNRHPRTEMTISNTFI